MQWTVPLDGCCENHSKSQITMIIDKQYDDLLLWLLLIFIIIIIISPSPSASGAKGSPWLIHIALCDWQGTRKKGDETEKE